MMMRTNLAAIGVAESNLARSLKDAGDGLIRARVAFVTGLRRPSTVALIAGTTGLLVFWFTRRRPPAESSAHGVAATSVKGIALAFIARYAMQQAPNLLRHVWAAYQNNAVRRQPNMPASLATNYPTADVSVHR
jgi:hypothetical protein